MTDETAGTVEEASVEEQPKPKRKRAPAQPQTYMARCTSKCVGALHDPDRNIRIPPMAQNAVQIAGPIKKGSWLAVQVERGLVEVK